MDLLNEKKICLTSKTPQNLFKGDSMEVTYSGESNGQRYPYPALIYEVVLNRSKQGSGSKGREVLKFKRNNLCPYIRPSVGRRVSTVLAVGIYARIMSHI